MSFKKYVPIRHSVTCYFCGELVDERESTNADAYNNNDGGSICSDCVEEKTSKRYLSLDVTERDIDRIIDGNVYPIKISVKMGDEGIVLDVWQGDEVIKTTYKFYNEFGMKVEPFEEGEEDV